MSLKPEIDGARLSISARELMSLIWAESSSYVKVRLGVALGLVLASSILAPLGAVALKLIVDHLTGHADAHTVSVVVLLALYILSQWLARSLGELRSLAYARSERRMARTLSERVFGHVMRLPLRFHLERQTGALTQTLENGLHGYKLIVYYSLFTLLPVLVQLLTITVILLRYDQPVFLLIFVGALACYGVAYAYFARQVTGLADAAASSGVNANGAITDSLLNYETVKLFAAEGVVQGKVSKALTQTEQQWSGFYNRSAGNGLIVAVLYAVFLGTAISYSVHQVSAGRMTVGDLVLVNTYMLQVLQPIEMLGRAVQSMAEGAGMLQKLLRLLREQPERAQADAGASTAGHSGLDFVDVGVSYRSEQRIVKGVTFHLPAGRTLGIVGASGAGKSTIVRLLTRLIEPDSGEILLDGTPIKSMSLRRLRGAIAVVPQDTVLFNDTIAYNIGFGRPGCQQPEIEAAARLAHLDKLIESLPEGYETRVGERGVKLSGGEKQRLSIARAAIKRPQIYVFDEATSSLDTRTEREILQNLAEISRHCTTLVIAHRLSTVVHADEIIVLDSGRIVERGTHQALLLMSGRYAALWEAQQSSQGAASEYSAARSILQV